MVPSHKPKRAPLEKETREKDVKMEGNSLTLRPPGQMGLLKVILRFGSVDAHSEHKKGYTVKNR